MYVASPPLPQNSGCGKNKERVYGQPLPNPQSLTPNPWQMNRLQTGQSPRAYTILSIAAAVVTIALKFEAYLLSNSVGLLSDAIESCVNLVAAIVTFWALTVASRPPDAKHAFGYTKAEYFSSALEAVLIIVAAVSIAVTALDRLWHPQPLEQVGLGLAVSMVAAGVNGVVGWILLRAGQRLRSITLRTDAHHLFSDVWTSIGVLVGILLVQLTGHLELDAIVSLIVAANIVRIGIGLLRETGAELMDAALPAHEQEAIDGVLSAYESPEVQFHALRTRVAGARRFVSLHILVPGAWSVQRGHDLCEAIELAIVTALPLTHVITHLEPLEDPIAWDDGQLDRQVSASSE
jgi:cation diffusion facilitator family transporter